MENKDLGSKKINNEQEVNEGFSGGNLPENYNPSGTKLHQELEKKNDGDEKIVNRARNIDKGDRNWNENESLSRDVNSSETEKNVENRDRNYDENPERYDESHPDNHHNRGNLKLDEE
ncbi:hypothetical protein [Flavobacterium sp. 3HN19-14]|uniref:hypothetical protein n=1 Tax=Flavobacterium sp. 3HN19-14 TaxID=3448133 RepID=UPI003EE141AE